MFEPRLTDKGTLENLGLFGDGDEISAIDEVERCFSVALDYSDAARWHSVGDVHAALLAALPAERRGAPDLWGRFPRAMARETSVDPALISPETLLLSPSNRRSWRAIVAFAALVDALLAILR